METGQSRHARQIILTLFFVGTTIVSLAYLGFAYYNYGNFYWTARDDLMISSGTVNAVHVLTDPETGNINVLVDVSVSNPTGYNGMGVHSFQLTFFFYHNGNVSDNIFSDLTEALQANDAVNTALPARSTVSTVLVVHLDMVKSEKFRQFSQTYQGEVFARTFLLTEVSTFLDPVMGMINTPIQQDLPIS